MSRVNWREELAAVHSIQSILARVGSRLSSAGPRPSTNPKAVVQLAFKDSLKTVAKLTVVLDVPRILHVSDPLREHVEPEECVVK